MSMKEIKKAVKRQKDDFVDGTLVTWVSGGKFTYAAIKTPVGWYTTASDRAAAFGIGKVITFETVLEILSRGESSSVRVIGLDDGTKVE